MDLKSMVYKNLKAINDQQKTRYNDYPNLYNFINKRNTSKSFFY